MQGRKEEQLLTRKRIFKRGGGLILDGAPLLLLSCLLGCAWLPLGNKRGEQQGWRGGGGRDIAADRPGSASVLVIARPKQQNLHCWLVQQLQNSTVFPAGAGRKNRAGFASRGTGSPSFKRPKAGSKPRPRDHNSFISLLLAECFACLGGNRVELSATYTGVNMGKKGRTSASVCASFSKK